MTDYSAKTDAKSGGKPNRYSKNDTMSAKARDKQTHSQSHTNTQTLPMVAIHRNAQHTGPSKLSTTSINTNGITILLGYIAIARNDKDQF